MIRLALVKSIYYADAGSSTLVADFEGSPLLGFSANPQGSNNQSVGISCQPDPTF